MSTKKANTNKVNDEKDMVLEPGMSPETDGGAVDTSPVITDAKAETAQEEQPAYVPYFLPKNILSNEEHQTVILNGKIYQVKAGVRVEVPKGVAEILDHALEQYEVAEALSEGLQK